MNENSGDKPVTETPEVETEDPNSPTVEQVLKLALKADLKGVVILGVSDKNMRDGELYFAASKIYDYPPDCFWIISEGMDAVKEVVRRQGQKQSKSAIVRTH